MRFSKAARRRYFDWELMEKKVDNRKVLDPVCKRYHDFVLFDNFRKNFSKHVVRLALKKLSIREGKERKYSIDRNEKKLREDGPEE